MDGISRHLNSVYASCCVFIMFKKIENPAACEMQSVICFLNAKNMTPAGIHRQLCDVYGEHAMSSSVVQRWVRLFNERRENVHDDPRSGRPSVVNEDLVRAVEERIKERTDNSPLRHFPCIFLKFHGHFFTKLCLRSKKPLPLALHRRRHHSTMKGHKNWCNADRCLDNGGNCEEK